MLHIHACPAITTPVLQYVQVFKIVIPDKSALNHTDRETLDKIVEQGLDEENLMDKDHLVNFFMGIKDKVRIEDLFTTSSPDSNNKNALANIHCINCINIWLCVDHWKQHKTTVHTTVKSIE